MLKEEYKRLRQNEKNTQRASYKITVRQLESLIRLSEAMARAHCDYEIKLNYVREVCRLMRTSNINVVRGEIELSTDIQEEINKERQLQRQVMGQTTSQAEQMVKPFHHFADMCRNLMCNSRRKSKQQNRIRR